MQAQQSIDEADFDQDEVKSERLSQYLMFLLNGEVYGINILNIREIIEYGKVTRVPMMPDCIAGVINLRGSVVPVVELSKRFEQNLAPKTKRSSVIIMEITHEDEKMEIGVAVDVVNEVLDLSKDDIEPAPPFGTKINPRFISGMGKAGEKLLVLLDHASILSIDELSQIEEQNNLD